MRLQHAIFFAFLGFVVPTAEASDASWIFRPGYYTHSSVTGQRVAQYEPEQPSIVPTDPTYQESGYRHQLYVAGNDRLNIVQTWGAGTAIRPYGEWEFPFRAGATPFGPWGNPQGPWTLPFDSWQNPYGWNRLPHGYGPMPPGQGTVGPWGWQAGPPVAPQVPPQAAAEQVLRQPPPQVPPAPAPITGAASAPPNAEPAAPRGQAL